MRRARINHAPTGCRAAAAMILGITTGVFEAAAALTLYSQSWFDEAGADKPRPYRSPRCCCDDFGYWF